MSSFSACFLEAPLKFATTPFVRLRTNDLLLIVIRIIFVTIKTGILIPDELAVVEFACFVQCVRVVHDALLAAVDAACDVFLHEGFEPFGGGHAAVASGQDRLPFQVAWRLALIAMTLYQG